MKNRIFIITFLTVTFLVELSALAFSEGVDPREAGIDKAIGGMEEGSRILSPHSDIYTESHQTHTIPGSHVGSASETPHTVSSDAALGLSQSGALSASHVDATHATSHISEAAVSHVNETEANHGVFNHGVIEESHGGETSSHGGTTAETSGVQESTHGAVSGGGAGENLNANTSTPIQTETGTSHEGGNANVETKPGLVQEIIQGIFGGGTSGSQGSSQGTASGGSSQHGIVQVNTETNLNSSNPTANGNVTIDTTAKGGIIDANTATTANTAGQEVTSGTSTQVESVGSSGSSQGSSNGSDHSIIQVNADANLNSSNPNVTGAVTVDPNAHGGLVDANTTTSNNAVNQELTSHTGIQAGSSSQEPASGGNQNSIITVNADANLNTDNPNVTGIVTIDPNAQGGLVDATATTNNNTVNQELASNTATQTGSSSSQASSPEPPSGGGSQNSIIEVNANTNLSSENPNVAGAVTIDPNASGGLVGANAATSIDIPQQELTSNTSLQVDIGASTTAAETTTVGTETGSTNVPATNEVQGGVEADVDAAGAGGDIGGGANKADGLSSTTATTTTTPKL